MNLLANRVRQIKPSFTLDMVTRASELKSQGEDVINFSAGQPDFNTPENIRNAAWGGYPLNQDWDQFYSGQVEIANKNYETNNVFFDTFVCVRDLVAIGVIYPIPKDPSKIPPEQMSIMKKLMQPK